MAPLRTLAFLSQDALDFFEKNDIMSVEDFCMQDLDKLPEAENNAAIQQAVSDLLEYLARRHRKWECGADMLEQMRDLRHFSTGIESLNSLLNGGFMEGRITEIVGASASGKTQLCMLAAASVAFRYKLGVAYVDTSSSFSAERVYDYVRQMAASDQDHRDEEIQQAMTRILHCSVYDIHSMLNVLHETRDHISKNINQAESVRLRLVVVDCPASVISPILGGSNVQGHALMVSVGQVLKTIALDCSAAVVITNNTVAAEGVQLLKPALGESWKTVPHISVLLEKQQELAANPSCTATLVKHTSKPCGAQVSFTFDGG